MSRPRKYHSRWLAYARMSGIAPKDGNNADYIAWNQRMWAEWRRLNGRTDTYCSPEDHGAFDQWLYDEVRAKCEDRARTEVDHAA